MNARTVAITVIILLAGPGLGQHAEMDRAAVVKSFELAIEQYQRLEARNYRVTLRCPALEAMLEAALAMGIPVPPSPQFELINSNGQHRVQAKFDDAAGAEGEKMQNRIRQMAGAYYRFAEKATGRDVEGFLRTARDSAQFDVIQSDAAKLEFEINEINEPFFGKTARHARLTINQQLHAIERIRFSFQDDKYMALTIQYLPAKQSGDPLLIRHVDVDQNAFIGDKPNLPGRMSVLFENYEFAAPQ